MENVFFLPCYMTCYNFRKSVKTKCRSRNCAISKMNLFVIMVYGFQSVSVVKNSLKFKGLLDTFLIVQYPVQRDIFFLVYKMKSYSLHSDCGWNAFSKTGELGKQLSFAIMYIHSFLYKSNSMRTEALILVTKN